MKHSVSIRRVVNLTAVFAACLSVFVLIGCNRGLDSAKRKLEAPAFAESVAKECDKLVKQYEVSQTWLWEGRTLTNYPALASLRPQYVKIVVLDDVTLCDIQITGGFDHAGILYTPKTAAREMRRGNWRIEPIDQRFYWYRE